MKVMSIVLATACLLSLNCTRQADVSAEESAIAALLNEESQLAIEHQPKPLTTHTRI